MYEFDIMADDSSYCHRVKLLKLENIMHTFIFDQHFICFVASSLRHGIEFRQQLSQYFMNKMVESIIVDLVHFNALCFILQILKNGMCSMTKNFIIKWRKGY